MHSEPDTTPAIDPTGLTAEQVSAINAMGNGGSRRAILARQYAERSRNASEILGVLADEGAHRVRMRCDGTWRAICTVRGRRVEADGLTPELATEGLVKAVRAKLESLGQGKVARRAINGRNFREDSGGGDEPPPASDEPPNASASEPGGAS
jgi:hypothetical protein